MFESIGVNLVTFKSILIGNINLITEIFISVLPKFIFQLDFYFYLK